jgi:hypothetical protein
VRRVVRNGEAEPYFAEGLFCLRVLGLKPRRHLADVVRPGPEGEPAAGGFWVQAEGGGEALLQGLAQDTIPQPQRDGGDVQQVADDGVALGEVGLTEFRPQEEEVGHEAVLLGRGWVRFPPEQEDKVCGQSFPGKQAQ